MLQSRSYKLIELISLFLIFPIVLALHIPLVAKIGFAVFGIGYCVWLSIKFKLIATASLFRLDLKPHLLRMGAIFSVIIVSSLLFIYLLHAEDLFYIVIKKPLLWLTIMVFYAVFSVFPQELLYRSFFFNRYDGLFKNSNYLLIINIMVFPLAHLFFNNPMVLLVTLIGGVFFTLTYNKSKSVLLTSIEHAIYGNWLFTVGMGEMLAFPMPK